MYRTVGIAQPVCLEDSWSLSEENTTLCSRDFIFTLKLDNFINSPQNDKTRTSIQFKYFLNQLQDKIIKNSCASRLAKTKCIHFFVIQLWHHIIHTSSSPLVMESLWIHGQNIPLWPDVCLPAPPQESGPQESQARHHCREALGNHFVSERQVCQVRIPSRPEAFCRTGCLLTIIVSEEENLIKVAQVSRVGAVAAALARMCMILSRTVSLKTNAYRDETANESSNTWTRNLCNNEVQII